MKIKGKELKECNVTTGYKCDVCGKRIEAFSNAEELVSTIKYKTIEDGGQGEWTERHTKHICSAECFIKGLNGILFDANIHLTSKVIDELCGR